MKREPSQHTGAPAKVHRAGPEDGGGGELGFWTGPFPVFFARLRRACFYHLTKILLSLALLPFYANTANFYLTPTLWKGAQAERATHPRGPFTLVARPFHLLVEIPT